VKTVLRALPEIARLVRRLVRDPVLPRSVKILVGAALLYLASPVDLVPDFIPLVGYVDDALLVAALVDGLLTYVDRRLVLKYWPGTAQSLDSIARAARLLSVWVPGRLKRRIFARAA
jgi:uncharacterized membrane protein YkvA (DUF1232 family)